MTKKIKEKIYYIPVTYQMEGIIKVRANSQEEADRIAIEDEDLPEDADFVYDSLKIDDTSEDYGYFEVEEVDYNQRKYEHEQ